MTDKLNNFSNSYFAYANYWRPSASLGTTLLRSSTKPDQLQVKHTWKIITITSCAIIAVTLVIGIYNAVIYKNVSNIPTALIRTTTADTKTTTSTTSAVAAAPTAASDTTTSSTTTTAVTTATIARTSPVVDSTAVVTTNPPGACPSMLPFGDEAGDDTNPSTSYRQSFPSFQLFGNIADSGKIQMSHSDGIVRIETGIGYLTISVLFAAYRSYEWTLYYRDVSSKAEQDAIACLVKNDQPVHAFVATWFSNAPNENKEVQKFQLILAAFGKSAMYVIRIYSNSLPKTVAEDPVKITFALDEDITFLTGVSADDIRGQRQIFDVAKPIAEDQHLPVVEEGTNCDIFFC